MQIAVNRIPSLNCSLTEKNVVIVHFYAHSPGLKV
jgi:hypothetical protein